MEDKELEKVLEDTKLIRNVMDRSYQYIYGLDKVFIWWGAALTIIGVLCNILTSFFPGFTNFLTNAPYMVFIPKILITIVCLLIYHIAAKEMEYVGLNKHLLIIWLAVLGFSVIIPAIRYLYLLITSGQYDINLQNSLRTIIANNFISRYAWITFILGMLCMWLLARVKAAGWFVLFYLAVYIVKMFVQDFNIILDSYLPSVSLLLLGVLLKYKSGNKTNIFLKAEV
jgi:hypothetical protein